MSERAMAIRQAIGVEHLGEIMWKSGYWQDTRSQAQAIVKILAGAELDFGPIASMNGVYIINGKTTLAANLVAAAIQRSDRYRYRVTEHDNKHCVIEFFELEGGKKVLLGASSFSEEDAAAAGLKGGNWQKFPRNMMFSRALTNGARWYTPDIFNGPVYTPDELGAEVDAEGNVIEVYEAPAAPEQPYVPTREQDVQDAPQRPPARAQERMVTSADERVWKRWGEVRSEALKYGIVPPNLQLPVGYNQLISQATLLKAKIEAAQAQLDREEEARRQGKASAEVSSPEEGDPWQRNRQLMLAAYEAGFKLRELPADSSPEQVELRNDEIEQLLEQQEAKA